MEGTNLPALIISRIAAGVNHDVAILFYASLLFGLQSGTIFLQEGSYMVCYRP